VRLSGRRISQRKLIIISESAISVPALADALGGDQRLMHAAAAALRNAAAKGTDISWAVPLLQCCSEDEYPFHKNVRETALDALRNFAAQQQGR
jgi:hypothetical protein